MIQINIPYHLFDFLPATDFREVQKLTLTNSHTEEKGTFAVSEGRFVKDIAPKVGKAKSLFHLCFPIPSRTPEQKEWRRSFKTLMQQWSTELQQANIQLKQALKKLEDHSSILPGDMQAVQGKIEFVRALIDQRTVWNERKGIIQALVSSCSSLDSAKIREKLEEQQIATDTIFRETIEEAWWIDKIVRFVQNTTEHFEKRKGKLSKSENRFLIDLSQFLSVLPHNSDVFNLNIASHIDNAQDEIREILQVE